MDNRPNAIVVDWGTTNLRASLVTAAGTVLDHLETPQGIATLSTGSHEATLMAALDPWFAAHGSLPVVALGMITSRNGWIEVPYTPCPAGPAELARGAVRRVLPNGAPLTLLSGLTDPTAQPFPDVMRGEETQIVGHGLQQDAVIVLPGTHSKWAQVGDGRITRFQTFVTGEVFALLINHSFIARGATVPPVEDPAAFADGLAATLSGGPMLSTLFAARTGGLAGRLGPDQLRSYVSGLVIGQEFAQARAAGWFTAGDRAAIVGNDGLNALYGVAATAFGLRAVESPGNPAIRGALAILRAAEPGGA